MIPDKTALNTYVDVAGRAKEVFITSSATVTSYYMTVEEAFLRVTTDASNAISVYLPDVREAMGRIYVVQLLVDGGVNVSIHDRGESDVGETDPIVLADAGDKVVLFSDGRGWIVLGVRGLTITAYDG